MPFEFEEGIDLRTLWRRKRAKANQNGGRDSVSLCIVMYAGSFGEK